MQRIVVLGAGYAGVRAVQEIWHGLDRCEVTLVDRSRSHQILTEMYRVAAGDERPTAAEVPLARLLPRHRHLSLLQGDVETIDWRGREVRTSRGALSYDYLLLCLGATGQDADVPGLREHALTLRYLDSAVRVRRSLRRLDQAGGGRVVVVGGGLTGVELAAEIAARRAAPLHLTIAQADPMLLPDEDPALAAYAEDALRRSGIELCLGERVRRILAHGVELHSGALLPADLVIWTGGVRANPVAASSGLPVDRHGRLRVQGTLEAEGHPCLFGAGDIAAVPGPGGRTLPATAQLAVQEGRQAAGNILRLLDGREPRVLRPHILGVAASLGPRCGIARLGRFRLTGRPGWAVHELALLRYLYGLGGLGLLRREGYPGWREPALAPERRGAS